MIYSLHQKRLIEKYKEFKFPEHKSMYEVESYIKSILDLVPASLKDFDFAKLYYTTQFNAFNSYVSLVRPILEKTLDKVFDDYSINLEMYIVKKNSKSDFYYSSTRVESDRMILFLEKEIGYIESNSPLLFSELILYRSISTYDIFNRTVPYFEYLSILEDLEGL